jgi:hypothetical protein
MIARELDRKIIPISESPAILEEIQSNLSNNQ